MPAGAERRRACALICGDPQRARTHSDVAPRHRLLRGLVVLWVVRAGVGRHLLGAAEPSMAKANTTGGRSSWTSLRVDRLGWLLWAHISVQSHRKRHSVHNTVGTAGGAAVHLLGYTPLHTLFHCPQLHISRLGVVDRVLSISESGEKLFRLLIILVRLNQTFQSTTLWENCYVRQVYP